MPHARLAAAALHAGWCLAALLVAADAHADWSWPQPSLPADAQPLSPGESIRVNGVPVRIVRWYTSERPERLLAAFKRSIERDYSVTTLPPSGATAAGGRIREFWVTLQVGREGGSTVATWSASPRFAPASDTGIRLPIGFPRSAQLVQQVDSEDAGRRSQLAVGVDAAPIDAVATRLENELRAQGFKRSGTAGPAWPEPTRYNAVFTRGRDEIVATLTADRGGTVVAINRLSALERLQ